MSAQDFAQVEGEVRVYGAHLADLIRQQPVTETTGWGEPVVHEGWAFVRLRRGPMLGAWRADLVRAARRLLGPDAEVVSHERVVLAKRDVYDGPVDGASPDEYGPHEHSPEAKARRKREGRERDARYKAKYEKVT
ncbi:MAG TPA: hypothetical protein VGL79_00260 [Solirubrobacteraceae bacterium]